jgi:beta-ureidopropionase / N-carbamoyl-L-amino-acid hydrolase
VTFPALWDALAPLGRAPSGGYRRYSWTPADLACRAWFRSAARARAMPAETDRNGNLWAWWGARDPAGAQGAGVQGAGVQGPGAIAVGSHLDSVPDGGAFDGPLGVVSAFAAIDLLRDRGFAPARPVAVCAFTEEEGARFGVACLGSRLSAGLIDPSAARGLRDADGVTLADAMTSASGAEPAPGPGALGPGALDPGALGPDALDPAALGPDAARLDALAAYVELHIEQGSALAALGAPVGLAESIWPHGRWRLHLTGRADHAGTTRIPDRRDPMLPAAAAILAARTAAAGHGALATIGKLTATPGAANGICSSVTAWLDARAPDEPALDQVVTAVTTAARTAAADQGVTLDLRRESFTPAVTFDPALRARLAATLAAQSAGQPAGQPAAQSAGRSAAQSAAQPAGQSAGRSAAWSAGPVPVLSTGAGHDAGILAARLPTAMLFVRNPTGVSHSPAEHADLPDCLAGVEALAAILADLAGA